MSNRKKLSKKERLFVYEKTQGNCFFCGAWIDFDSPWHAHHYTIPYQYSRTVHVADLVASHPACNLKRGAEYRFSEAFNKDI